MRVLSALILLLISLGAYAQVNIVVPTLEEGALHYHWWLDHDQKVAKFQNSTIKNNMKSHGLFLYPNHAQDKVWSTYRNGKLSYYFFTNIENPIEEKFLIQRIKKTVRLYNKGKVYLEKVTYLVEAFKTWTGYEEVEGTLKRADEHSGKFHGVGGGRKKVVIKEFETGVGTIEGIATDNSVWPFGDGSLYYGTKYDANGAKLYNKVKFTDSHKWTLNLEIKNGKYILESPELGFSQK